MAFKIDGKFFKQKRRGILLSEGRAFPSEQNVAFFCFFF